MEQLCMFQCLIQGHPLIRAIVEQSQQVVMELLHHLEMENKSFREMIEQDQKVSHGGCPVSVLKIIHGSAPTRSSR